MYLYIIYVLIIYEDRECRNTRDKKFQRKKLFRQATCLPLETQRDLYAIQGKLLNTSERGQQTILIDVESFGGTLIYPKGAGFSKTWLLRKTIKRAVGKRRISQS